MDLNQMDDNEWEMVPENNPASSLPENNAVSSSDWEMASPASSNMQSNMAQQIPANGQPNKGLLGRLNSFDLNKVLPDLSKMVPKSFENVLPYKEGERPPLHPSQAAGHALTIMQPELLAARGLLPYAVNALGRIGTGAVGNTLVQSPQDAEEFKKSLTHNLGMNALLESAFAPLHVASKFSDVINPIKYMKDKVSQIRAEKSAAESVMNKNYSPVNQKYNDYIMTVTPKDYLEKIGIEKSSLYPDAKITYERFLDDPSFRNLHDLKSKIGADWAAVSTSPATKEKAQLFNQMTKSLDEKIRNLLSHDKPSLDQYNLATEYAKNVYYPYLSTPTLKKINNIKNAEDLNLDSNKLLKTLKNAREKTIGTGKDARSALPEEHSLRNHLNDIEKKINTANALKETVPEALRKWLPDIAKIAQNPFVLNLGKGLEPGARLSGRSLINYMNQNQ